MQITWGELQAILKKAGVTEGTLVECLEPTVWAVEGQDVLCMSQLTFLLNTYAFPPQELTRRIEVDPITREFDLTGLDLKCR